MAFKYGQQNRFYDQIISENVTSAGDYGPVLAGGDVNGALAIVLTCTSNAAVSGLKLTYKQADTETGSYTAPSPKTEVTFGGSAYVPGDTVGALIIPNGAKDYIKATVSGTISSGGFAAHLQYLAR